MGFLKDIMEKLLKPKVLKVIWLNRINEFKRLNETEKQSKIVILGDSITEEFQINNFHSGEWIANRGIAGDTTFGVLKRMDESVYDINPKKLFILIGTNDIDRPRYSEIKTAENIKKIIEKIKINCPSTKIYIQSVYPINDNIEFSSVGKRTNALVNRLNTRIIKVADESEVQHLGTRTVLENSKGELSAEYTNDGLHLNDEGYVKVFQYLLEYIKD